MKFSTVVLAAAIGVAAHPSGHAHRNAHRSIEARDTKFVMAKKPAPPPPPPPPKTTEAPPPPPPKPTKAAPPPAPKPKEKKPSPPPVANAAAVKPTPSSSSSSSSSSGGQGQGPTSYTPFCGGQKREVKRATLDQIAYQGNIGTSGNYGCNMQLVNSAIKDKYKYSITLVNDGDAQGCKCFNKIGKNKGINGFFSGNEALSFNIPSGGKQVVVFDSNSQGSCTCHSGSVPLTSFGQFGSTWAEFDFGNESNGDWSGIDASCLVAAKYGMNIPGLKASMPGQPDSIIFPGGKGKNAFLAGMEQLDGIGMNIAPGDAHVTVQVDYKG